MSMQMQSWLEPVLTFYGLHWPDIDEDKVNDLGGVIANVSNEGFKFALRVDGVFKSLAKDCDAQALKELQQTWHDFAVGPVQRITDDASAAAFQTCLLASNAVAGYKAGLLAILTVNVGADALLIASGAGLAAAGRVPALAGSDRPPSSEKITSAVALPSFILCLLGHRSGSSKWVVAMNRRNESWKRIVQRPATHRASFPAFATPVADAVTPGEKTPPPAHLDPNSFEATVFQTGRPYHEPKWEPK